jgi:quercetin dioxygenase-like cupin family protein
MKLVHTESLPELGVSHDESIKKKVFIDRGVVPQLMMFGSATFKPGQFVETHQHDTMYEVFYIQSGRVDFIVNGDKFTLTKGDCMTIEQGELHSQHNVYDEDVTWVYFGIATD